MSCLSLAAALVLHAQADPNALPFTNARHEGFENRVLELLAGDLGMTVEYRWRAERRGFFRTAFGPDGCDVVPGVPADFEGALTTLPYYRSGYAIVTRRGGPAVRSLHDARLRQLRLGVQIVGDGDATPPGLVLAELGLAPQVRGYSVYGDYAQPSPAAQIMAAVAAGDVDAAFVWGPLAGYFATREAVPLEVRLLPERDAPAPMRLSFAMALGVHPGREALRDALNGAIRRRRKEIGAILREFAVPRQPLGQPLRDSP